MPRYLKYTLDQYVESDYTVVYFHYGLSSQNKPSLGWLQSAYKEFDRKYVPQAPGVDGGLELRGGGWGWLGRHRGHGCAGGGGGMPGAWQGRGVSRPAVWGHLPQGMVQGDTCLGFAGRRVPVTPLNSAMWCGRSRRRHLSGWVELRPHRTLLRTRKCEFHVISLL